MIMIYHTGYHNHNLISSCIISAPTCPAPLTLGFEPFASIIMKACASNYLVCGGVFLRPIRPPTPLQSLPTLLPGAALLQLLPTDNCPVVCC